MTAGWLPPQSWLHCTGEGVSFAFKPGTSGNLYFFRYFNPVCVVSKIDLPLASASARLSQTAPRSTEHACCRDEVSELLASFWLFFHCHHVKKGLTKAGPALLESWLQELYSCWRVTGSRVLKALHNQWEPWGMEAPILDPMRFSKPRPPR